MSTESDPSATSSLPSATNNERREALIKLGKYAAYATPVIVASVSAVQGAPVSGPAPQPVAVTTDASGAPTPAYTAAYTSPPDRHGARWAARLP